MKRAGRPEALADAGSSDERRGAGCRMPARCLVRPPSRLSGRVCSLLIVARCRSPPGSRGFAARRLGEARRPGSGRQAWCVVGGGSSRSQTCAGGHGQARRQFGNGPTERPDHSSLRNRPDRCKASRVVVGKSPIADRRHGRSAPGPPGCRGRSCRFGPEARSCSCRKWTPSETTSPRPCCLVARLRRTGSLQRRLHARSR